MERIDLHTHSTASDGSFTPTQVIEAAARAGLKAVALTDHDTIAGIPEAMAASEKYDIEFIPGIELSAFYLNQEVHIVGLFLDINDEQFIQRLENFRQIRDQRNIAMVRKMTEAGIDISIEKIREMDGDAVITRANFARYLLHIGYISSIDEAFDKYLSPGKPFFVPKTGVTPRDAIQAICDNGGIAILAHPLSYKFTSSQLDTCVELLKSYGLKGIETRYSTFSAADERDMKRLADRHRLLYSGGSDFHGNVKPHISIGKGMGKLLVPYDFLKCLKDG